MVLYFTDVVKGKNKNKNEIIMKPESSPDYLNCRPANEMDEQTDHSAGCLSQAIENAGGVPYKLIFGTALGEGYFQNVGNGIRDLFGVTPEELTEQHFQSMIDEVLPLNVDVPEDRTDARGAPRHQARAPSLLWSLRRAGAFSRTG